jgi:flavin reductase (DIM6/NTAB) family NADH-FMN oxidoreductase RutF
MKIDPSEMEALAAYKLAVSLIVPRPIAWVGSRSTSGIDNLAPFSYFMGVSTKPPSVAISVARGRRGVLKDTAQNILDTNVFTVSMVSFASSEQMVGTSASIEPDVSEFDVVGLDVLEGDLIAAPRPTVALASMECSLVHSHDMGSTHLLVGEVLRYHLADEIVQEDTKGHRVIDLKSLDAVGRLGGREYCRVQESFEILPQK